MCRELQEESDHLLVNMAKPMFKKGIIRPELKDLMWKVEAIQWTRLLNPAVMNCTFADILINVVQVLEK